MDKVLVTGFGPYGNTLINPAHSVARAVDGCTIEGAKIVSRIVPNEFFTAINVVRGIIDELRPVAVLMLGEYSGRSMITIERVALNYIDATRYRLTDNVSLAPQGDRIAEDGPTAYMATVPIRAMVKAMREEGIPTDISESASTFVCNHLMYGVLHHLAITATQNKDDRPIRAGWVHLPALPATAALEENLGEPSMSSETSAAGLKACIRAILQHTEDIEEAIISRLLV